MMFPVRAANRAILPVLWRDPALELETGDVVADLLAGRRCVFLTGLYRAEQVIAERLRILVSGGPCWPPIDAAKAIPWVERRTGLRLAASQREAVRIALASKVLVITGGPGVGKTTLVNSILRILIAKQVRVALGGTTGRAAKRLSDATDWRRRPSTGCWRRTRGPENSVGRRSIRSTAICSWWTRPAWSTFH